MATSPVQAAILDAALGYVAPLGIRAVREDCRVSTTPPESVKRHEPPFEPSAFVDVEGEAWFVEVVGREGWHPCVVRVEDGAQGPYAVDFDWL